MNFNDVREWIRTANREDLQNLSSYMKLRYDQIGAEIGMSFTIGEAVEFDTKNRGTIRGKFLGIKRKNASVITDQGLTWRVGPSLLRKTTVEPEPIKVPVPIKAPIRMFPTLPGLPR